jgi:hypothetical protein
VLQKIGFVKKKCKESNKICVYISNEEQVHTYNWRSKIWTV